MVTLYNYPRQPSIPTVSILAWLFMVFFVVIRLPSLAVAQEASLEEQLVARSFEEISALDEGLQIFALREIAIGLGQGNPTATVALDRLRSLILGIEQRSWRAGELANLAEVYAHFGQIEVSRQLFRDSAMMTLETAEDPYEADRMLDQLARQQADSGDLLGLLKTFSGLALSETGLDRAVLLVQAHLKAGDISSAESIVRHYDSSRGKIQWIDWRIKCQVGISESYASAGKTSDAQAILSDLLIDIRSPDIPTAFRGALIATLAVAYSAMGNEEEALSLLEYGADATMIEQSPWAPDFSREVTAAFIELGYPKQAGEMLGRTEENLDRFAADLRESGVERSLGSAYTGLVSLLHDVGDAEGVVRISEKLVKLTLGLNDDDAQSSILWFHAKALAEAGYFELATQIAKQVRFDEIRAYAIFDVVEQLVRVGRLDEGYMLAVEVSDSWKRAEALVLVGQMGAGLIDEGRVFNDALSAVRSIQEPHWRAVYWVKLSSIAP